jgi:hypothetical protein
LNLKAFTTQAFVGDTQIGGIRREERGSRMKFRGGGGSIRHAAEPSPLAGPHPDVR